MSDFPTNPSQEDEPTPEETPTSTDEGESTPNNPEDTGDGGEPAGGETPAGDGEVGGETGENPSSDEPPAEDPPLLDPGADPSTDPTDPFAGQHVQSITRRIGYASSPVDDTARRQQITTDWDEIEFLRLDCGWMSPGRLIIVLMSLGFSVPDHPSGYWTFRLYAGEGEQATREDSEIIDELTFPVTGEPFNPVGVFNFPTQKDYTNLTLWVESHLSEGSGEIHLSAANPRRMHSSVMAIDSGPV